LPCLPNAVAEGSAFGFQVTPNPAADQVTLSYRLHETTTCFVDLRDLQGKQVLQTQWNPTQPIGAQTLDLPSHIAPGIYFLRLMQAGNSHIEKLFIRE
jgi:Secretion system C-terminal sorting domain